MKSFIAGQDLSFEVLFELNLETVVPDVGSVTYDLRDNAGALLRTGVAVITTVTSTQATIVIAAADNGKTLDFENRTLIVKWKANSVPHETVIQYRLIDFIPLSVNPDSVRALLGLSKPELPDADIDLYAAYLTVRDDFGAALVSGALTSGDVKTLQVNRAIAVAALLAVLGSIEIRVIQQDKSNTAQLTRFSKIDFTTIRAWLGNLYDSAKNIIVGEDPSAYGAGVIIGVTTPTTDPVTGQAPETGA